jgi:hypothetical protein
MGVGVNVKLLIVAVLMVVGVGRGQDWPVPNSTLDDLLSRSSHWNTLSTEKQAETRSKLTYALHLAGSLEAQKTFFTFMKAEWDSSAPEARKKELIKEAESLALESAKKTIAKWVNSKTVSGKPMNAHHLIVQISERNLSTEQYNEWDRFLNDQGELNLKSWALGADPALPEKDRASSDLPLFLSKTYPGTLAERRAEALRRQKDIMFNYDTFESSFGSDNSTHDSSPSMRPCGTPGSFAPTLRPEFNGRQ